MKNIFIALMASLLTSFALAHGDGESRVSIEPASQGSYAAGVIHYQFQIFDEQTQKAISDKDLSESNTKIMHFIAYDSSRNEFNHVHPAFDGKIWSVDLNLLSNGTYFFWSQGQLLDGTEFSAVVKAQIVDGKSEIPVRPLPDKRKGTDRLTTIELAKTKIKAGKMAMINFKITREDGQAPELTPYLGAMAHVIAASPDGDELTHVHPVAGSTPNTGVFHATFPTAGDYRIWVQFNDKGELKTIPLSIVVSK